MSNRNNGTNRVTHRLFYWCKTWLTFVEALPSKEEQAALFRAISQYGLYEIIPTDLTGAAADYFANEIRPELDRQHKRDKKRKAR